MDMNILYIIKKLRQYKYEVRYNIFNPYIFKKINK